MALKKHNGYEGDLARLTALAGGALGTYNNVRNASGPRERAFAIRMSAACWLIVASMLVALRMTHGHTRFYVLVGYFIVTPPLLYRWSTMHQMIRMLDQRERDEKSHG